MPRYKEIAASDDEPRTAIFMSVFFVKIGFVAVGAEQDMLYEEAEMERIVAAAMGSDACRAEIESIKAEAGNAAGTILDDAQKPNRSRTSKSDDDSSEEEYEEDFLDEESDEE